MAKKASWVLAGLVGLFVAGCGSKVASVKGKVTMDGQPLKNATVEFQPEDNSRPSRGVTDESGYYRLKHTMRENGALIGSHKVRISTGSESDGQRGKPTIVPEIVPAKYNVKSELVKEVKSGSNEINFDLDSKGEKIGPGAGKLPEPRTASCGGEAEENPESSDSDADRQGS